MLVLSTVPGKIRFAIANPVVDSTLTESLEDVKHAGVSRANCLHIGEVVVHVVDAVSSHQSVGRRRLVPVDGHARVGDFLEDHFQRLAWH